MRRPTRKSTEKLLDPETREAPVRLTDEDLFAQSGPGWRRRGGRPFDMEDDR